MTFKITDELELNNILTAYRAGAWQAGYKAVYKALTYFDEVEGTDAPLPGVDLASWVWVAGAQKVNNAEGAFGNYIRDYTARQYELRSGEVLGESAAKIKIQAASDQIARNFLADVLKLSDTDPARNPGKYEQAELNSKSGTMPDLETIGRYDAAGAASQVFNANIVLDKLDQSSTLAGTDGDDYIHGADGDDTILGSADDDVIDGGDGYDILDYSAYDGRVWVNDVPVMNNLWDSDVVVNVEEIIGSKSQSNILNGGEGVNVLKGGAQSDSLTDGTGEGMLLYGGGGQDIFNLAAGTFVMDAEDGGAAQGDFITWGPYLLSGGVRQSWDETGWARMKKCVVNDNYHEGVQYA